jgi:roadblock/LC7 domain-containing protein
MTDFSKLMQLDGALAAFEFDDKGELVSSEIADKDKIDDTVLDLLCHVCVANTAIATMQARGWEKMTGMQGFYPVEGISLIGFDWTAIVNGKLGVILPNDRTDLDAAYAALGV